MTGDPRLRGEESKYNIKPKPLWVECMFYFALILCALGGLASILGLIAHMGRFFKIF